MRGKVLHLRAPAASLALQDGEDASEVARIFPVASQPVERSAVGLRLLREDLSGGVDPVRDRLRAWWVVGRVR